MPISDEERDRLNRCPVIIERPVKDERDYFYRCTTCEQMVDCRRYGDVLHHEEPAHRPIPTQ
jgi:rRNA maturation endonuclease Nob1